MASFAMSAFDTDHSSPVYIDQQRLSGLVLGDGGPYLSFPAKVHIALHLVVTNVKQYTELVDYRLRQQNLSHFS